MYLFVPLDSGSHNTNEYCTFHSGFCLWRNTGSTSWIWHAGNGRHFNPFLSDIRKCNQFIFKQIIASEAITVT